MKKCLWALFHYQLCLPGSFAYYFIIQNNTIRRITILIKGIGVDIFEINKLRSIIDEIDYLNDSFIKKTYTKKEIELAESRPIPITFYATRFAGKEAVFKSLAIDSNSIRLNQIEILSDDKGQPYVNLYENAKRIAKEKEINQILISLSYDNSYAIAYVVVQ